MALLEAHGLVKYYGRRKVVDGVCFEVDIGEIVGLLGPNGAGKTTSFRMTTGQLTPFDGRVVFDEQDVTSLPMYKRARLGMGYLSQETSVFRKLTTEQNILAILEAMPRRLRVGRKPSQRERRERTREVLEQVGLTKVRKNVAARLSGGEKRRLEIARCLVCEPLLILLDEPFTGIDPPTIADIQQIVRDLRDQGIGILVTDHQAREILKATDRIYVIKDGVVRTQGTPLEIVQDPVAINEYLGTSFNDDPLAGFRPKDTAHEPSEVLSDVVEKERAHRLVEQLTTEEHAAAATELYRKPDFAIPALLEALERRDPLLRERAYSLLRKMMPTIATFDPHQPEEVRRQQLHLLRESVQRKAG